MEKCYRPSDTEENVHSYCNNDFSAFFLSNESYFLFLFSTSKESQCELFNNQFWVNLYIQQ